MAAPVRAWAADLHHFWFHELKPRDWWRGSAKVDSACRQFEPLVMALHTRPPHEFLDDPRTALAGVLLFDQIPRNIWRDSPRAFAFDPLARELVQAATCRGFAGALSRSERQFLFMPLMHSEAIADQKESLMRFARLGRGYGFPFARSHARMIRRFGRFPHRNQLLERTSTPAEKRAVEAGFSW